MTAGLVVLAIAVTIALAAAALVAARRRVARHEARRAQALASLADRLDAALAPLRRLRAIHPKPAERSSRRPSPLVGDRLPGRAALVEEVAADVAAARADGSRLALALSTAPSGTTGDALLAAVREITGRQVYAVGPSSFAVTLPRMGRAEALGALARIEAVSTSSGNAVELEPGEQAVEFVTRLLARSGGVPG